GAIVELALDHLERGAGGGGAREAIDVGERGEVDGVAGGEIGVGVVEQAIGAAAQLSDLGVGQRGPPLERLRPLERRGAVVQPDALHIGMTVPAERWPPWFGCQRCARSHGREDRDWCEKSTAHVTLRSRAHQRSANRRDGPTTPVRRFYATRCRRDARSGGGAIAEMLRSR